MGKIEKKIVVKTEDINRKIDEFINTNARKWLKIEEKKIVLLRIWQNSRNMNKKNIKNGKDLSKKKHKRKTGK